MTEQIIPKDFYVYMHLKATTKEPFYVGKGQDGRAWDFTQRNRFWNRIAKKHGVEVVIVQDGLQQWASFELEREMIALHGRRNLGLGPLVNLTDGGEGVFGAKHSKAHRAKKRKTTAGLWADPSARQARVQNMKAGNSGAEIRALKRKNTLAVHQDPERRAEYLAKRNTKKIRCIETDVVFETSIAAQEWLESVRNKTVYSSKVRECCRGNAQSAYGYTWAYA
jgi:hypothetical protein